MVLVGIILAAAACQLTRSAGRFDMGFVGVVIEIASSIFQVPIVAGPWLID